MPGDPYYGTDLAYVHHAGYSQHVERTAPGLVALLRAHVPAVRQVLDVGCGSGLLARKLLDAGFGVHGVDASPAMIELARTYAPGATFGVARLPGALPQADAVVSTGHVLNYLDTHDAIAQALRGLARAVRPGGLVAFDLLGERFAAQRDAAPLHAQVTDDWVIVTRYSCPQPRRFDRAITVFRRVDGAWRRSDEAHRNVMFEPAEAVAILRDEGVEASARTAFGDETLPEGLAVIVGIKAA
jgi:SAM-dependent methyltransferase